MVDVKHPSDEVIISFTVTIKLHRAVAARVDSELSLNWLRRIYCDIPEFFLGVAEVFKGSQF